MEGRKNREQIRAYSHWAIAFVIAIAMFPLMFIIAKCE